MTRSSPQLAVEMSRRGLVSVVNGTSWRALQVAVRDELPWAPPYQLKLVQSPQPHPPRFDSDVDYLGDWSDEALVPFDEIEWIRIRPRILRPRGRRIPADLANVEEELLAILQRLAIPFRHDASEIWIFGCLPAGEDPARNSRPPDPQAGHRLDD